MTAPYHLKFAPKAKRKIEELSSKHQKMFIRLAEALSVNPRPPGARKIEGMIGLYCETVPPYRLIYKIDEQEVLLLNIK